MIIETKIDFKSYFRLMLVMSYRKPVTITITIIGIVMILISSLYFVGVNLFFDEPPYFPIYLSALVLALVPYSTYNSAKKNYSTYVLLQEKIIYDFNEDKIIETGETFDSEIEWSDIYNILELNEWFVLYHLDGSAIFLPKKSFGLNLDEFKGLISSKNIAGKLK